MFTIGEIPVLRIVSLSACVKMLPATTVSLVTGSRIYDTLAHLATDNNLIFTDMNHLSTSDVFYCNDAGSRMSWIDHVLSSVSVNDLVSSQGHSQDFFRRGTKDEVPFCPPAGFRGRVSDWV